MRRALISWTIGFALLVAAFALTVAALNSTLYSAGGFVRSYLDTLARHDATGALALPGVQERVVGARDLLTEKSLGDLSRIQLVSEKSLKNGTHTVTYTYRMGKQSGRSSFTVRRTGAGFGLFSSWAFAKTPLATIAVSVLHDDRFRANGTSMTVDPKAVSTRYLVFAPGLYHFDHRSPYLRAGDIPAAVSEPGSVTPVQIDVQANKAFIGEVQKELDGYLASCAKQHVLLPTGCPFGKTFDNRVVSVPQWSIVARPAVRIQPGSGRGRWSVPATAASAHLTVKVQSLFDGTVSTFDRDIPFTVGYAITVGPADQLTIKADYH